MRSENKYKIKVEDHDQKDLPDMVAFYKEGKLLASLPLRVYDTKRPFKTGRTGALGYATWPMYQRSDKTQPVKTILTRWVRTTIYDEMPEDNEFDTKTPSGEPYFANGEPK